MPSPAQVINITGRRSSRSGTRRSGTRRSGIRRGSIRRSGIRRSPGPGPGLHAMNPVRSIPTLRFIEQVVCGPSKINVVALTNGKMYSIGSFGKLSRSYADILEADWQVGDKIVATYSRGVGSLFSGNYYKLENKSNNSTIFGDVVEDDHWVRNLLAKRMRR